MNGLCAACSGLLPRLSAVEASRMMGRIDSVWRVVDGHHLEATYTFLGFGAALAFVNQVGELAEAKGHHPEISLSWGSVRLTLWTHAVNGLTEADFLLAASIDALPRNQLPRQPRGQGPIDAARPRPDLDTPYAPPRNPVEKVLAELWARALGIDEVGVHDDFMELGGDSQMAMRLLAAIEERFGRNTALASIFDRPTIASFAREVFGAPDASVSTGPGIHDCDSGDPIG